jgi:hypothetical protein
MPGALGEYDGINQSINQHSINLLQPNQWRNGYAGASSGGSKSDPNATS